MLHCGKTALITAPHDPIRANQARLLSLFASKPSRSRPSFRRAKTKRGIQTP